MTGTTGEIVAAGGVLWRTGDNGAAEVAVVHRPKYDDWTLPKGKADAGEHPARCALREIEEETGFTGALGRSLGDVRYLHRSNGVDRPKVVSYWVVHALAGAFVPGAEVDELRWLPPEVASGRMSYDRDREVLAAFAELPPDTTTVLLVRHASAGEPEEWPGEDRLRPLDRQGRAQAQAMAEVLRCWAPRRVLAADVLRCHETVQPLARRLRVPVEDDPLVGESHYWDRRDAARDEIRLLGAGSAASVVCSQGGVVPDLVERLVTEDAVARPPAFGSRKGSVWALSFIAGRLVAADYHPRIC